MQISSNCQRPIRKKVRDELKPVGQTAKGCGKNSKNPAGMSVRSIKSMKAKLKAQTITIYAMKSIFDIETDDPVTDYAGNSFGGRKEEIKPRKERPSMILMKNDLHPLFGFWINLWDWLLYFIRDRGGAMKP